MYSELASLQDDVPGFPAKLAANIISQELGAPPSDVFDTFEQDHIAAASLGQVLGLELIPITNKYHYHYHLAHT